jgi:hypothetical protein
MVTDSAPKEPPRIELDGLPNQERRHAGHIQFLLSDLAAKEQDFVDAVTLFDYCAVQSARHPADSHFRRWPYVAARDGALSINNFAKIIGAIGRNFGSCPTVLALVDRDALKTANRRLGELFPNYATIRHAVAHLGETLGQPTNLDRNAIAGPVEVVPGFSLGGNGAKVVINGALRGREYTFTIEGELESYELSRNAANGLMEIRGEVYKAFIPVASETKARAASRFVSSDQVPR